MRLMPAAVKTEPAHGAAESTNGCSRGGFSRGEAAPCPPNTTSSSRGRKRTHGLDHRADEDWSSDESPASKSRRACDSARAVGSDRLGDGDGCRVRPSGLGDGARFSHISLTFLLLTLLTFSLRFTDVDEDEDTRWQRLIELLADDSYHPGTRPDLIEGTNVTTQAAHQVLVIM